MTTALRTLLLLLVFALPFASKAQITANAGGNTKLCNIYPYGSTPDTVRLHGTATGGLAPYSYSWNVYDATGGAQLAAAGYLDDSTAAMPALLRDTQNNMQAADRDSIVAILQVTDANSNIATDTAIVKYQRISACILGYSVFDKSGIDTFQVPNSGLGGEGCQENYAPLTFLYWTPGATLVDSTVSPPRSFATQPNVTMYHAVVQDAIGCIYQNGDFGVFNGTTSIATVSLKDVLHIFPQPATDRLSIDAGWLSLTAIAIYSMDGRLLNHSTYNNTTKAILAMSYLKTGSYLLEVQVADGQISRQVFAVNH